MWHFLFSTVWGWLSITGIVVIVCGVVAWLIPSLRLTMLAVAGAVVTVTAAYTKGKRDQAALEQRRKEAAIAAVKARYDKIRKTPSTHADVEKSLKDGTF